jgi:spore maturation protein CgeD
MCRISVILTSYNNPNYLTRAIDSVLNQTYNNYELIIADDNSSNLEVINIINRYTHLENVIAFSSDIEEEYRLNTARYATQINTAVGLFSTGDYLCYLADDDYYYPEILQKFSESIEKYGYDVLYCNQEVVDVDDNKCGIRFPDKILDDGMDILDHNQVITSRFAFDSVNGWEDDAGCWGGADGYFWRRLSEKGHKFYPIDYKEPLQAKMYRERSVQWNIANGLSPDGERNI